jgi:hypothetical protein
MILSDRHLKNALGVSFLSRKNTSGSGMYLCPCVSFKDVRVPDRINKKTTQMFLELYGLDLNFKLNPKYPNFYVEFKSTFEVGSTKQLTPLFIKIDFIFFCSKILSFSFFNTSGLPFFFYSFFSTSRNNILYNFYFFIPLNGNSYIYS